MQILTIEINSKNLDFTNSLDIIKSQIEDWFFSLFDQKIYENYHFKIT